MGGRSKKVRKVRPPEPGSVDDAAAAFEALRMTTDALRPLTLLQRQRVIAAAALMLGDAALNLSWATKAQSY